ncbi:MAG: four-carbon acid sugar kinase family protein [Alphaproteobacteria bacterium]|nr:four-carbon acid sugar kinase family protein [Alphaproteobacteria bacterium]MDP6515825.1 four-carbon acid sugar kinase family protein [Alphaproteobacteria bacterium]
MLQIALVADDLTGAFDSAAPFAMRGLATRVICEPDRLDPALIGESEVVAVTTGSRHIAPRAAADAVERAWRVLGGLDPDVLFKKIDSTLRGNVAAEIIAAMAASGRRRALVTPAMPAQGRTTRGGMVYVGGVALAKTEFAQDPVAAPSPLPLTEQLERADPGLTATVIPDAAAPSPTGGGRQAWVADCADQADLDHIAEAARARTRDLVLAGSAGLAEALAGALFGPAQPRPQPALGPGIILYVVGSRSPASTVQARRLAARADCVTLAAPAGRLDVGLATSALAGIPPMALVRVTDAAAPSQPLAVAEAVGHSVARLLERVMVCALVVTGGDTVAAVLAAIDRPAVDLWGELQPGIPLGVVDHRARRMGLVTKAGGFGAESLFLDIPQMLGANG